MEKQIDPQALMERGKLVARQLRKSDIYPVLVGGIAGGIAGTLMAGLIAGRASAARSSAATEEASIKSTKGLPIREAMQLVPIIVSLIKQVQEWTKKQSEQ